MAGHFLNYDIQYHTNQDGTLTFTARMYRSCMAVQATTSIELIIQSVNNSYCRTTVNLQKLPTTRIVNNTCQASNGECLNTGGYNNQIQEVIYEGTVNMPSCGRQFMVKYEHPQLTTNLTTIVAPHSKKLESHTYINLDFANNSPVFHHNTVVQSSVGTTINYAQGAVEIDGDSLAYELIHLPYSGNAIPAYTTGLSATHPLVATSTTLNALTGEITVVNPSVQYGVVAIKVKEYRYGILIGSQTRLINFEIFNNANMSAATISNLSINNNSNINTYVHCSNAENNVEISFEANTTIAHNNLSVQTYFNALFPNAVVTTTGTNPLVYNIVIPSTDIVNNTYNLDFFVREYSCSSVNFLGFTITITKDENPDCGNLIEEEETEEEAPITAIAFPDVFTPNGDGIKDIYRPLGIVTEKIVNMRVTTESGDLIHECTDGLWDGTSNNILQANGIYYIALTFINDLGEIEYTKSYVHLEQ